MNRLTENFTLAELTATNTGLDNTPTPDVKRNLLFLAGFILQPTRDRWGRIRVTSGYRGPLVNEAVGGSATSQHPKGEAGDIIPEESDIIDVFKWLVEESRIMFGQAILEMVGDNWWIHVSLPRLNKPNNQILTYDDEDYEPWRGHL